MPQAGQEALERQQSPRCQPAAPGRGGAEGAWVGRAGPGERAAPATRRSRARRSACVCSGAAERPVGSARRRGVLWPYSARREKQVQWDDAAGVKAQNVPVLPGR